MIEYTYYIRVVAALLLSIIIGWEREHSDKEAGIRTIMLISLGTVSFTLVPYILLEQAKVLNFAFDFSRILSYIIGSVGFLAGIVIVKTKKQVEGITTAACTFSVVSYSMLCGIGEYILASFVALMVYLVLKSKYFHVKFVNKKGG